MSPHERDLESVRAHGQPTRSVNVLVIEDDPSLADLLGRVFREEGHTATLVADFASGLGATRTNRFDAIILDWMLPDGDGLTLAGALRTRGDATPILMLTARAEVRDKVGGLKAGVDDYLTKPFEVEELLARLHALVRRSEWVSHVEAGALVFDQLQRRCRLLDTPLDLTTREYQLLLRLALARGQPVSRAELLADVWQLAFDPGSGVLEVQVSRIREKLGADAWRIETVRGVGYRLRSDPA